MIAKCLEQTLREVSLYFILVVQTARLRKQKIIFFFQPNQVKTLIQYPDEFCHRYSDI